MKTQIHVLKSDVLKPKSSVICFPVEKLKPCTRYPIEPITHQTNEIEIKPLQVPDTHIQEISHNLVVASGAVKYFHPEKPKVEKHKGLELHYKVNSAAHTPVDLYLPLPPGIVPDFSDNLFQIIKKKYPLLKKEHLILLKYYPGIPRYRVLQLKMIQGILSARFRLPPPAIRNERYYGLLFFLDSSAKKTLTVEIPQGKALT
ncbi:MAG: hypothetical protein H3C47_13145 [Candidatus Cloacimonetes bacterium]|nr:hypothetical protein [Candidatus Cloacimonadota bacterium]